MVNRQFDTITDRGPRCKFSIVEPDGHYIVPKSSNYCEYSKVKEWRSNRIWNYESWAIIISKGLTTW